MTMILDYRAVLHSTILIALIIGVQASCTNTDNCPRPTLDDKGTISPDKSQYDAFESVTFGCDNTSSLVGVTTSRCESGGTWNPSTVPSCADNCDAPPLDNGGVTPDQDTFENGDVLVFVCNANYTLVGISTTTCRDGSFDQKTPTCFSMCLPPVVANSDYATQLQPIDHSTTITVECDPGYSTGTGTDTDMTCSNGNFDVADPVCYENCGVLSSTFPNGQRSGDTSPYYHGEEVTYICDTGYTLVGAATIICTDGSWSADEPFCLANCDVGAVPNSDYASGGDVNHGSSFDITCDLGYSTGESRVSSYTCDDGTLTPSELPTCYANCYVGAVPNSDYASGGEEIHGSFFFITCNDGYSTGKNQVSSYWCDDGILTPSELPICYANCVFGGVPNSDYPNGGDVNHGSSFNITCDDGYSTGESRASTYSCGDGTLTPSELPTCNENTCNRPNLDDNGIISPDKQEYDAFDRVDFGCEGAYTLVGVTPGWCESDGTWNPSAVPSCAGEYDGVIQWHMANREDPDVYICIFDYILHELKKNRTVSDDFDKKCRIQIPPPATRE
ncbi:sushi, von Willebrand factor type A, EGF and pentraxin domain-containing protein 1-like [Diadema antillarum]|uniref:sushi, von Willebrand factor type A, EGF and pentraxin domain-containing protein 1-like n=1 Tax=Diadema antillarum TaxID=105358 RepID=UPI003A8C3696